MLLLQIKHGREVPWKIVQSQHFKDSGQNFQWKCWWNVAFLADSWFKISIIVNRINCSTQESRCLILFFSVNFSKTENAILANVSGLHHWILRERTSEDCRIPMPRTCHYPDLGSASEWSCWKGNLFQPMISTTQILVMTRHQYGTSELLLRGNKGWCLAMPAVFSGY